MKIRAMIIGLVSLLLLMQVLPTGHSVQADGITLSVTLLGDDLVELTSSINAELLSIDCINMETGESGSARLLPLTYETSSASHTYLITLKPVWAALPYPINVWSIDSKPLAIITQRDGSPLWMSPAELRQSYAQTTAYMLETASHTYPLPVGDGVLNCTFIAANEQGVMVVSEETVFEFGRGLPEFTFERDHTWPADVADWPTWMLTGEAWETALEDISLPLTLEPDDLDELTAVTPSVNQLRSWDDGTAVGPWIGIMMDGVMRNYVNPPRASHLYALVSVAMYESLVAQARVEAEWDLPVVCRQEAQIEPIDVACDDVRPLSEHMVVAGAAETILMYWFPKEADRYTALVDQVFDARLSARTHTRAQLEASLALGRKIGAVVVARTNWDNSASNWDGELPAGVTWQPTPPQYAPPLEVMTRTWKPWNLERADQFRPPPPPAPDSDQFEDELQNVYAVSQHLTTEQQQIASSWEDKRGTTTPAGHWNIIALELVRTYGWSTPDAAQLFATLNTAQHDAFIAAWDTKYAYWSIRPVTAIRVRIDPDWLPYMYTPAFPSYVSGHATVSMTAGVVLAAFFPSHAEQLLAWADEAALSRIYGGIHFQSDNVYGQQLGRSVAEVALEHVARAQRR